AGAGVGTAGRAEDAAGGVGAAAARAADGMARNAAGMRQNASRRLTGFSGLERIPRKRGWYARRPGFATRSARAGGPQRAAAPPSGLRRSRPAPGSGLPARLHEENRAAAARAGSGPFRPGELPSQRAEDRSGRASGRGAGSRPDVARAGRLP